MKDDVGIPLDKRRFAVNSALIAGVFLVTTGVAVAVGKVSPNLGIVLAAFSVAMALLIAIPVTGVPQIHQAWLQGVIGPRDLAQSALTILAIAAVFASGLIHPRLPGMIFGALIVIAFVAWVFNKIKGRRTNA